MGDGVDIGGGGGVATGNVVEGNYDSANAAGTAALPNGGDGIKIGLGATNNTIGGTVSGARNIISGNVGDGVVISGSGTTGNLVEGNYIGTNAAGTAALGNATDGVQVSSGATGNTIGGTANGAANVISGNGYASGNPLPTGITSFYQANGNANDSVSGINGSAVGSVSYVAGVSGSDQAFGFNGSDYVQIPYSTALQPNAPD